MSPVVDKILLGDNPFIGVNHLSQERTRQIGARFDSKYIAGIMDSAFSNGAQGIVCSAHPLMRNVLDYLRAENYSKNFGIYLIVPNAQAYIRLASERGMIGLLSETFTRLSLKSKTKAVISGGISALTANPMRIMRAYIDAEASLFAQAAPTMAKMKAVFLHEILTELIVSFKMKSFTEEYIEFVRDSLGLIPGFVTRNLWKFVDFAISNSIPVEDVAILTPFNKVGFQMNPSRELCEDSLSRIPRTSVIGMSVLASGFLNLKEAVDYLNHLARPLSCVAGVSQERHAQETFRYLQSNLR